MHDIIERFVGRYQVWRAQRAQNNPLDFPAVMACIGLAQIAYDVIVRHHATWWIGFVTAIDVAFLALYFRRSPWAWFILPVWGVMILLAFPSVFSLGARYPLQIVVLTAVFGLTLGIGLIAWGLRSVADIIRTLDISRDPPNASNKALQPTATRCAFTFFMIKTVPEFSSLAPGSRG